MLAGGGWPQAALLGAMGGGHSAEGPWVDMGGPGGASLGYRISPRVPFWGALEEGAFLHWRGGISLGDSLERGGTGMPCGVEVFLKMWEPFWGGGPSCGSEVGTGSPQLESRIVCPGVKGSSPSTEVGPALGAFGVPRGG